MGRNNRQRRAAKARAKARKQSQHHGQHRHDRTRSAGSVPLPLTPAEHFVAAVYAERAGEGLKARRVVDDLAREARRDVALAVAEVLERQVASVWDGGWQPSDIARLVTRNLGNDEHALFRWMVAAQAVSYDQLGSRVAPGWMAQLHDIEATRGWDPQRPYLLQLEGVWTEVIGSAVRLMSLLYGLPVVPRLTDPPSAWREGDAVSGTSLPAGVLSKVRALLAKAEATTFEQEAEALTAKAQELMARHRIDQAVIAGTGDDGGAKPVGRRVGVDDPYADAKAALIDGVARANGCQAVWSKALGFATVFGFPDELVAVEELFTSLLVQATTALAREGSKRDEFGRGRTTRFRRSFLVAFAARISQRLHAAVEATIEEATNERSAALVPVLARREEATATAAQAAFPEIESFSPTATDGEGWYAGTLLGDRADLSRGPELTSHSR